MTMKSYSDTEILSPFDVFVRPKGNKLFVLNYKHERVYESDDVKEALQKAIDIANSKQSGAVKIVATRDSYQLWLKDTLIINKNPHLTIEGIGPYTPYLRVDPDYDNPAVKIDGGTTGLYGIEFRNLFIAGKTGTESPTTATIEVINAGVRFHKCIIEEGKYGIYIDKTYPPPYIEIMQCHFERQSDYAIYMTNVKKGKIALGEIGSYGGGVYLDATEDVRISDNVFEVQKEAIKITNYAKDNIIKGNTIYASLESDYSHSAIVIDTSDGGNVITGNKCKSKVKYFVEELNYVARPNVIVGNDCPFCQDPTQPIKLIATYAEPKGLSINDMLGSRILNGDYVPVGTGGTYGNAYYARAARGILIGFDLKIVVSGVASGETITVKIEVVYADASTSYIEKSFTADGEYTLTLDDKVALLSTLKRAVGVKVYAKSDQSSTSATVRLYGVIS